MCVSVVTRVIENFLQCFDTWLGDTKGIQYVEISYQKSPNVIHWEAGEASLNCGDIRKNRLVK